MSFKVQQIRWLGEGMLSGVHQSVRSSVEQGFKAVYGREPSQNEAQFAQAVAWSESSYGRGWKDAGKGSFNMGAIQSGKPPCNPEKEFLYTDTHPTKTGSVPYQICFKKYSSAAAGWAGLIQVLYKQRPSVLAAAQSGDIKRFSTAMYDTTYYEGFGPTREARIGGHAKRIKQILEGITKDTGESMPAPEKKKNWFKTAAIVIATGGAAFYGFRWYTERRK